MKSNILTSVMVMIGLGTLSLIVRFALFSYMFGKPINEINTTMQKQFKNVAREMDAAAAAQDTSTREAFQTDEQWEAATFASGGGTRRRPAKDDDDDADAKKPPVPVVPPSSWVIFATTDANANRTMHARLVLAAQDATPFLKIEFIQPAPVFNDTGGTAQISYSRITQANCAAADGVVLRFDNGPAARYPIHGTWVDAACRIDVPDFPSFRAAMVNATTLNVRLAKGNALTEEIPAPVAGLSWPP